MIALYVIGAAINLPFSMQFLQSRIGSPKFPVIDLRGSQASVMAYPAHTPHATPWPLPDKYTEYEVFGYRRIDARAELPEINDTLAMQFELTGWPLPVFETVHCWWPEQPPWKTNAEPDPVMRLHWAGVILNPLFFALAVWTPLIALPLAFRKLVRRRRLRRGLCPDCAYPTGESARCSECGVELPTPRNQIA